MRVAKRTAEILKRLDEAYGVEDRCGLDYETDWQLLFATQLSAFFVVTVAYISLI